MSVRSSVFEKDGWQDVGMTRAEVLGHNGNESTIQ